ncbi:hypothetical protein ACHAXT_001609 [Thalassiosira profunda]
MTTAPPALGRIAMTVLLAALTARRAAGSRAVAAFVGRGLAAPLQKRARDVSCRPATFLRPSNTCNLPRRQPIGSFLQMSTAAPAPASAHSSLMGIDFVRESVVEVLNDLFDPAEIARGAALAKLDGKKKKKKKKKQPSEEESVEEPKMSEEERASIIDAAVAAAQPFTAKDAMVTAATKAEFGDYQCNAAMSLAKAAGMNPRECAQKIAAALEAKVGGVMEMPLEIAGPGFINLRFRDEYLAGALGAMAEDSGGRLAVPLTSHKQKIVVDFSSPNIAKEMHVGHLRSTIIGDTLSNLLTFAGHDVLRLNHVGDWGTQFGMLVEHLRDEFPQALNKETAGDVDLGDLVTLYKAAKQRFDKDEEFKVRSREGVVKLQAGDAEALAAWESLCAASRAEYQKIYDRLNIVGLEERGESFYNPYLNGVIDDLEQLGLAVESEGATAVFLEGYANRDGSPLPMLVRKSDGGFNYATTDLAAIRQRVEMAQSEGGEGADRVLYVTDAGQSQHFEMVFAAAKKAGFVPKAASLEHVPFGLVQGEDGKKFATRSGDTVKLKDLLDEAVRIAGEDVQSRAEDPDAEMSDAVKNVTRTVGIGAVKYADLSMNRESNYKFSYGRMLSLNGNTAPYMLYAYARICGIVRKATGQSEEKPIVWPDAASEIVVTHESERQLIRNLVKLPDILSEVESELYPNRLCDYLFQTSQAFNQFYENCSVNQAETPELKASRLSLCTVSAATIRLLMNLLGIPVVEKL